jgi:hypothetical protein
MPEHVLTLTEPCPESFTIVNTIAGYPHALEVLATTSTDSLNPTMPHTHYANDINLTHTLNTSKNWTEQFTTLLAEAKDIPNEHNTTITNRNTTTTKLTQLQTLLTQTLALVTTTTTKNNVDSLATSCKGQTNPKTFSGEDYNRLWLFIALVMARISTPPYVPYFPYVHIHSPYSLVLLTLARHSS